MDEKKYRVLNRDPKPGDLIRLTGKDLYSFDRAGDIKQVTQLGRSPGVVWARGIIPCDWSYSPGQYEVVEVVEEVKPEEVKPEEVKPEEVKPEEVKPPKYRTVNRDPKPGDLIRLLTDGGYKNATPGSVVHVLAPLPCGRGMVSVRAAEVNPKLSEQPGIFWVFVLGKSCELVEEIKPQVYYPADVNPTRPAESDEDDDEDGYSVTLEEDGDLSAFAFLHSVRGHLRKVTFTDDGDIVAEFK